MALIDDTIARTVARVVGGYFHNRHRNGRPLRRLATRAALVDKGTGNVLTQPVSHPWAGTEASVNVSDGTISGVVNAVDIQTSGGDVIFTMGEAAEADVSAEAIDALHRTLMDMHRDQFGGPQLRALPGVAASAEDPDTNDSEYNGARPIDQERVRAEERDRLRAPFGQAVDAAVRGTRKHDAARTSMEYHEWAHNVWSGTPPAVRKNAKVLNDSSLDLKYVGVDPPISEYPPWHAWVQYEDYRKCINIVKRYRRARSACGGKALWTEQGFGSKELAIIDDVQNDAEVITLVTALDATADWTAVLP